MASSAKRTKEWRDRGGATIIKIDRAAQRRAVDWVKTNRPDLWKQFLREAAALEGAGLLGKR